MIVVFSVFEPSTETEGNWARLYGCAYLPGHEHGGERWTGRAWFGDPPSAQDRDQSPYPLVDEQAVRFAEDLGFSKRTRTDLGTSILIVGCDSEEGGLSSDGLKRAAETWWWPRLTDGNLVVELVEQGVRKPGVDPTGRMDLQPFIQCREAIRRGHGDEEVTLRSFNRKAGHQLGDLALMGIAPEHPSYEVLRQDRDGTEDRQGRAPAHRSVAYVRHPGMVVTYRAWSIASQASALGTFQASEEIDQHLKLSEPMEHDRWDPHSRRLGRVQNGHEIVNAVEQGIRKRLREFLNALRPPPPPPKTGLQWLGRRLGEILAPRTPGGPVGPEGERGGVSIVTTRRPRIVPVDARTVRVEAAYSIALKPEFAESEHVVTISPRLNVLEGDDGSRGDLISIFVGLTDQPEQVVRGESPDLTVRLSGSERREIGLRSEPYSGDWAVSIHIEVIAAGTGEEA